MPRARVALWPTPRLVLRLPLLVRLPARCAGQLGPCPEALAAYEAVRVPAASQVQHWSLQLLRQFQEGKPGPSEVDVNIEQGFVKRRHAPLVPASA